MNPRENIGALPETLRLLAESAFEAASEIDRLRVENRKQAEKIRRLEASGKASGDGDTTRDMVPVVAWVFNDGDWTP